MYIYKEQKHEVFKEKNQKMFLNVMNRCKELMDNSGCFKISNVISSPGISGDTWFLLACIDRLVELDMISLVTYGLRVKQDNIYEEVKV